MRDAEQLAEIDELIARMPSKRCTMLEFALLMNEAYIMGYKHAMKDALKMTDAAILEFKLKDRTDG